MSTATSEGSWSAMRADLLGGTKEEHDVREFSRKTKWVLDMCDSLGIKGDVEWRSDLKTPADIMGELTRLFYMSEVDNVTAHMQTICALHNQLRSALVADVVG
jgi:hypothetical protein